MLHDATHLEERTTGRLLRSTFWVVGMTLLLMTLIVAATWALYDRPLKNLAEWMRRVRTDAAAPRAPPVGLPVELLATESDRLADSFGRAGGGVPLVPRHCPRTQRLDPGAAPRPCGRLPARRAAAIHPVAVPAGGGDPTCC